MKTCAKANPSSRYFLVVSKIGYIGFGRKDWKHSDSRVLNECYESGIVKKHSDSRVLSECYVSGIVKDFISYVYKVGSFKLLVTFTDTRQRDVACNAKHFIFSQLVASSDD